MPSVLQEIQVQRLKDAISSEHLAREVAWPQAVRRFPRRPLSTCRREWNIWECTQRESRPATPPWQINREILGGASKQAEPINALSIHSVNSLVDKSNFNAVADNFNAHAANFLLCQLFSSAGICSAAFSLHHFQVIHTTHFVLVCFCMFWFCCPSLFIIFNSFTSQTLC